MPFPLKSSARKKEPFVLAIDIGTSSTKSALFDGRGNRILETTVQRAYTLLADASGRAELEPDALSGAFDQCLHGTIAAFRALQPGRAFEVAAVSVSCFWHSLLGLNSLGSPASLVVTWADSRCREDAAWLRSRWDEKKIHAATGCMLRTSFWPAKLRWLYRTQKPLWKRVDRWVSPSEWLMERWCGQGQCAPGMATGTGLFRPSTLKWDPDLLLELRLKPERLNSIGEAPSKTLAAKTIDFPELQNALWFPAIGDGAASNLGSGAVSRGLAALNIGTSAALRVMRTGAGTSVRSPFGLFCYRVDAERFLTGGAISNAGNLRAWCLRELHLPSDPSELEDILAQRPYPVSELTILPFWLAERAPYWRENMPSYVRGLNAGTTAIDLLQATSEAVYYRIALIAGKVRKATGEDFQIVVSGGAQKSPSSMRRLANILNQPLYPSDEPEASLRGAAVFALEKLNAPISMLELRQPVKPEPRYAEAYQRALAQHSRFEETVWQAFTE